MNFISYVIQDTKQMHYLLKLYRTPPTEDMKEHEMENNHWYFIKSEFICFFNV